MYSLVLMMAVTGAPQTQSCWLGGCAPSYSNCNCGGGLGMGGGSGWPGGIIPGVYSYACSGCAGNVTSFHSCVGYRHDYWMPFSCFGYGIYGGTTYNWPTPIPLPVTSYGYGYPRPIESSMPRILKKEELPKPEESKPKPMSLRIQPDRAKVVVRLPADAKLYVNGQPTEQTSSERSFWTPALSADLDSRYTMKIEYNRDGNLVADSRVVKVRAGEVSVVEFADRAARAISTIKIAAPEGTKVFLDNRSIPTNEYKTPALAKGVDYSYVFRAELSRDGKNRTQSQKVVFKAGESVTVDFMDLNEIRTVSSR
jgi:uncharacterized protein (TIGR03000 family)